MRPLNILPPIPASGADAALLGLRVWTGATFLLVHGPGKVGDIAGFTAKVASKGIPLAPLLGPAAALSEFLGGLLLLVGLGTRVAAVFLCATMLVAGFHIHAGDPLGKRELALTYAVVALALAIAGGGRWSMDARLARRA